MKDKWHSFFIPVMGTGFTLKSPQKVARFSISSVIPLLDDILMEQVREHECKIYNKEYEPIINDDEDARAERTTAYLNLVDEIVSEQIEDIKTQKFEKGTELTKYFELLPNTSQLKKDYNAMLTNDDLETKLVQQKELKKQVKPGFSDVNIMTSLDGLPHNSKKDEDRYARSALRGYGNSNLESSIVFSAGLNKGLYKYIKVFDDFYPNKNGHIKKKIIIKVSDYRSAIIQGSFLAKKGLWVSEFRIESGLNCGGHAFATKGYLMGPVLEEFKEKKKELTNILHELFIKGLNSKGKPVPDESLPIKITAQGGITTAYENNLLLDHYDVDATGWGTPFLIVQEATSIDDDTLEKLLAAKEKDICMSDVSPMGITFQNLINSKSEEVKNRRITEGRPGAPCCKNYLEDNTEFIEKTKKPICTASRQYQKLKIEQLNSYRNGLPDNSEFSSVEEAISPYKTIDEAIDTVTEKSCICHELGGSVLIEEGIKEPGDINPSICPGPNIAYFNKPSSLTEMIEHIYGKQDLLSEVEHPNMFITELNLYIKYLPTFIKQFKQHYKKMDEKEAANDYIENLFEGIEYYQNTVTEKLPQDKQEPFRRALNDSKKLLEVKQEEYKNNLVLNNVIS